MRKKISLTLAGLILILATLACRSQQQPAASQAVEPPVLALPTNTPDYSGPCSNVLYPFIPGRQWIYQKLGADSASATPDPLTSKFGISVVEVSASQAVLNSVDLATGATTQTTVECQEGSILNFPMMTLGSLFGNYLSGDVQTVYVSGVFAPAVGELEAAGWDMTWEGEYIAAGTVAVTSEGETTTIVLRDSPITMTWKNAGQETVSVPAGTFENAYKVTRTTLVQASISMEGVTAAGTLKFETVHWFAPYVGMLKSEVVSVSLTTFGLTFPVEAGGAVELVEVR